MRPRLLLPLIIATTALVVVPPLAAQTPSTKPGATSLPARDITPTSAVVKGTVNPRGLPTTVYFAYGIGGFQSRTPDQSIGKGTTPVPVGAPLTALKSNTTYRYRVVAVSSAGTSRGATRTFKTEAAATPAVIPQPSKLELARATIYRSSQAIDILAPITARASGNVALELYAAGMRHRWSAPIDSADGRIRNRETIPAAQANKGTGILTITYPGDPDTRPQVVRLRAANVQADLDSSRPTIEGGRLRAQGTISGAARGNVRVQLEYFSGGVTTTLEKKAPIANGSWSLDAELTPAEQLAISQRRGPVHSYILFTGYLPAGMRGEMQAYQVLP